MQRIDQDSGAGDCRLPHDSAGIRQRLHLAEDHELQHGAQADGIRLLGQAAKGLDLPIGLAVIADRQHEFCAQPCACLDDSAEGTAIGFGRQPDSLDVEDG